MVIASTVVWLFLRWLVVEARWSIVTERTAPSPRFGHTAVWGAHYLWVHAGSGENLLSDLWLFDASTGTWRDQSLLRNHSVSSPPRVHRHSMVWDSDAEALWIFGGFDGSNFLKEVWKYAGHWLRVVDSAVPGPCARSDHVALWDASTSAIWIHGGFDGTVKDDLWRFDTREGSWSKMPESNQQPSARANHAAAWDDTHSVLWIHAGHEGSVQLHRDLWRFSTSSMTWYLISNGGPSARAYHVSAWDPLQQVLWIHGGKDVAPRRDLWSFDAVNYRWQLVEENTGPSRRFDHVAAFDVGSRSIWIHGGYEGSVLQDLWKYEIPTPVATTATPEDFTACYILLPVTTMLIVALLLLVAYWWLKRSKQRPVMVFPLPPREICMPTPPPLPPDMHMTFRPWPPSPAPARLEAVPVLTLCRYPKNTQLLEPPPDPPQRPVASFHMQLRLGLPDLTRSDRKECKGTSHVEIYPSYSRQTVPCTVPCSSPLFLHPNHSLMIPMQLDAPHRWRSVEREVSRPKHRRPCIPRPMQPSPNMREPATYERGQKGSGRLFVVKPAALKDVLRGSKKPCRAPNPLDPERVAQRQRSRSILVASSQVPINSLSERIGIPLQRRSTAITSPPTLQLQPLFLPDLCPKPQLPKPIETASLSCVLKQPSQHPSQLQWKKPSTSRFRELSRRFSLKSTLGGPWYTAPTASSTPGPGHYDPEHPGIFGRIPGLQPGFPRNQRRH